ncbi:MAG: GGDEF domain-containing protein [Methanomassiliicoccales archaeon]
MFEYLFTKVYSRKTKRIVYINAYILLLILAWLDFTLPVQLQLSVFYLVPIFMQAVVTKHTSAALLTAVLCGLANNGSDLLPGGRPIDGMWLWNTGVILLVYILFALMVSVMKQALERESMYARTDTLTGLPNRMAFNELAQKEFSRCKRSQAPITIAYIDCDDFKLINDRYGHAAGDQLLQNVGDTIQQQLRVTDIVARIGGDELVVMLPETGSTTGLIVVERLRESLIHTVNRSGLPITFSIGVAVFKELPENIDEMLKQADRLMYEVKYNGKNQIKLGIF